MDGAVVHAQDIVKVESAFLPKGVNFLKVAYPKELFERTSITSFLSGPAGNIFGMKAVKNLRLVDVQFPLEYMKDFKGPNYGKMR